MTRGLRVVAGSAGGLHLVAPKGARPTTDRVKEALFASLGPDVVNDARVLDLFAGSGALGIEALSRGADRALFVDRDRHAIDAIHSNLATTGFSDRARVVRAAVATFVRRVPAEAPFDLVCCDPPYDTGADDLHATLDALDGSGWLTPGATVVLESRTASPPRLPENWQVARERAHGDTLLVVATV
jgi:16S rRNA (guanine966-N2)-methyltransferase